MRIVTVHKRNPNLTTAELLKVERLERRIRSIIAAANARGPVARIRKPRAQVDAGDVAPPAVVP